MPTPEYLPVSDLKLDLHNFRTVPQKSESKFLHAVVTISPDPFWALAKSLLQDGYIPTESIIVLKKAEDHWLVKEGNRRVAAIKWILGLLRPTHLNVPSDVIDLAGEVTPTWKDENRMLPCTVFSIAESAMVEKIVSRTHGKAETSGRDPWHSVARARHNREVNMASEPALDLLEKYVLLGTTGSVSQKELWTGDFPLTVLEEALKALVPRLGKASSREIANAYPTLPYREAIDELLRDIGLKLLGFPELRDQSDILHTRYGFPSGNTPVKKEPRTNPGLPPPPDEPRNGERPPKPPRALPLNDPRAVKRALGNLDVRGRNREKVVTLINEARKLNLKDNPFAFCFLLRSIFEISAKAYCDDHRRDGLKYADSDGRDRTLAAVLHDVTKHLTKGNADKQMVRRLHPALTEIDKKTGVLSVTSMNQLVHHPNFSVGPDSICGLFFNVLPLLEELNG